MRIVSSALLAALGTLAGCSLGHRSDSVPAAASALALTDADTLALRPLAPGVSWVRAWLAQGPWSVHVLEIDTERCRPEWEARKPAGTLDGRALTSDLADGAIATMNADFFQLPGGTPVGTHVRAGVPLIGPSDRAAWLWSDAGMYAGVAALAGGIRTRSDSTVLVQVNRAANRTSAYTPPRHGATLFTARAGRAPPADGAADVVRLRGVTGDESAGSGVVVQADTLQSDTLALGEGSALLQLHGNARRWSRRRQPGDTVHWHAQVVPPMARARAAREAVGGYPVLLRGGRDVLAETETRPAFGAQRHPRSAIGWNARHVFLVLVDGRQSPWSSGMTLPELTAFLRRLGATDAINLDGGGSSALVIGDRVVNRPSDPQGERAVGNALALRACR